MRIALGDVVATCPHCGGDRFAHLDPGSELHELSELLCRACEAPTTYAELIMQIGAQALEAARKRLR